MAIHYNGSALWLDAQKNGNPWLNPYSTAAVEYAVSYTHLGMKRLPDEAGGAPAVEDPASMKPVE